MDVLIPGETFTYDNAKSFGLMYLFGRLISYFKIQSAVCYSGSTLLSTQSQTDGHVSV